MSYLFLFIFSIKVHVGTVALSVISLDFHQQMDFGQMEIVDGQTSFIFNHIMTEKVEM